MITLHEAIRSVQDELIKSQQERELRNIPPLFETEKLTVEFSCVFSENDSTDTKSGINALSVLALDATRTNSVSLEKIQKVILEFKTVKPTSPEHPDQSGGDEDVGQRTIPPRKRNEVSGLYPYKKD